MKISNNKRQQIEKLIYDTYLAVDKSGANSNYYKKIFSSMDNDEFYEFLKRRLPFRFHEEIFEREPTMTEIFNGFKVLNKPLLEKVKLPYLYKNEKGVPVQTKEALVGYIYLKRLKQFLVKKTSTAMNIDHRDMKTGLLLGDDKGALESDREFEALAIMGLDYTMDEFSRFRADAMKAKSESYNVITTKGYIRDEDVDVQKTDSLAKNYLNVYLIGCNIHSNLIDEDYYTPLALKKKKQKIIRN